MKDHYLLDRSININGGWNEAIFIIQPVCLPRACIWVFFLSNITKTSTYC